MEMTFCWLCQLSKMALCSTPYFLARDLSRGSRGPPFPLVIGHKPLKMPQHQCLSAASKVHSDLHAEGKAETRSG